jgi:hypothetical protein
MRTLAMLIFVGCASSSSPSTPPKTGSGTPPPTEEVMADHISIYPAAQLQAWLDKHRSDPSTMDEIKLRLPVKVTLSANKMDVQSATIGDDANALAIKIDDSTMNIPLAGKLPMFYGEGTQTGTMWLIGLWRGGQDKRFQVIMAQSKADSSATTAEIFK